MAFSGPVPGIAGLALVSAVSGAFLIAELNASPEQEGAAALLALISMVSGAVAAIRAFGATIESELPLPHLIPLAVLSLAVLVWPLAVGLLLLMMIAWRND